MLPVDLSAANTPTGPRTPSARHRRSASGGDFTPADLHPDSGRRSPVSPAPLLLSRSPVAPRRASSEGSALLRSPERPPLGAPPLLRGVSLGGLSGRSPHPTAGPPAAPPERGGSSRLVTAENLSTLLLFLDAPRAPPPAPPQHLPCISPAPPQHFPSAPPCSLHRPYISPISRLSRLCLPTRLPAGAVAVSAWGLLLQCAPAPTLLTLLRSLPEGWEAQALSTKKPLHLLYTVRVLSQIFPTPPPAPPLPDLAPGWRPSRTERIVWRQVQLQTCPPLLRM